jgi:hypothetical protein
MASPALEVPTLCFGNCASWDRQKSTPLELAPPGAVDQPGGGVHSSWAAAAGTADPASMAAAAKVSRTRRARRERFTWVLKASAKCRSVGFIPQRVQSLPSRPRSRHRARRPTPCRRRPRCLRTRTPGAAEAPGCSLPGVASGGWITPPRTGAGGARRTRCPPDPPGLPRTRRPGRCPRAGRRVR